MTTPLPVVRLLWDLINARRSVVDTVVDFGAGDGRFAQFGKYRKYVGYELDEAKIESADLPPNAILKHTCALETSALFSGAIGNPPFIRNQDLGRLWRRRARELIYQQLGAKIDPFSNLYLYFVWLALARTVTDGIVGMVVPFDWTYRPSAEPLRRFIKDNQWSVDVYRLSGARLHFPEVKTTPSLTLIDKRQTCAEATIWDVSPELIVQPAPSTDCSRVFAYARRDRVYACRGFSPGSQEVFALTESERKESRIPASAVVPCVTSLRGVPRTVTVLNSAAFRKHFVEAGRKCWLLKTDASRLAPSVSKWLKAAPGKIKNNTTCRTRNTWYRYSTPGAPQILLGSGFRAAGLHFLRNAVDARNLGSVFGVFGASSVAGIELLLQKLRCVDFNSGVVADARGFRRIEVGQLNAILAGICRDTSRL